METRNDWWTAAQEWDSFTKPQRAKTRNWLEKHLGDGFMDKFGKKEESLRNAIRLLACWDPIKIDTFYVEAGGEAKMFMGLDLKLYATENERDAADENFRRLFPEIVSICGDKLREKIAKEASRGGGGNVFKTYHVKHKFITQLMGVPNGILPDLGKAIADAKHLTGMYVSMAMPWIQSKCDYSNVDWMRPCVVEVPKKAMSEAMKTAYGFSGMDGGDYSERLFSDRQDDEFIDFLRGL